MPAPECEGGTRVRKDLGRIAVHVVMTALCAVLVADTALAQDALLVTGRFYSASRSFGQDLGPAPFVRQSDIFGGSRYAVIAGRTVVDARTGATFEVPDQILALDRARPRVFVLRETGVWSVDVASGAEVAMWLGDGTLVRHCALAYSANVLFCAVYRDDGLTDVVAIDAASQARTIAAVGLFRFDFTGNPPVWIVSSDGRRLYFGQGADPNDVRLAALDTTTGAITTSTAPGRSDHRFETVVDEVNERLIVYDGQATVLSKDLAVLGVANIGRANLVISPHTGRLYLGQWVSTTTGGCCDRLTLSVLDAKTYASLARPAILQGSDASLRPFMAVLTAPGAPKDLTATVLASQVTLTWTNVGGASGFVLDVGLAPGRTDLQIPLGPDARVTFPNVPSGIYFLRVRGGNENGGGRPSSEITLVVP